MLRLTGPKLKGGDIPGKHGEILYGNFQGVIYGAYKDEGEYSIHGDPSQIPPLPDFIYDQMLPKPRAKKGAKGWTDFWDDVKRGRPDHQVLEMLDQCLSVIPNTGLGGYDTWIKWGMCLKSTRLDGALDLWRKWSFQDPEYHEAGYWDNGADPCADKWDDFEADGGLAIGSLILEAKELDPEGNRLPPDLEASP